MKDKINHIIKNCVAEDIKDRYSFEVISKGYSATLYSNVLVNIDISLQTSNRIIFRGNDELKNIIPNTFKLTIKYEETEKKTIPVYIIEIPKDMDLLLETLNNLSEVIICQQEWIFEQHPADFGFGCCSHYEECSKAGTCTEYAKNRPFYKGCAYKRNLEDGKIFYGENRNV